MRAKPVADREHTVWGEGVPSHQVWLGRTQSLRGSGAHLLSLSDAVLSGEKGKKETV